MTKKDHSIRNSVIATLIATAIIAGVKPFRGVAFITFKWLWGVIIVFVQHLITPISVPMWLIYVGILILLVMLWIMLKKVFKGLAVNVVEQLPDTYITDTFYGLMWRWRMNSDFRPYQIAAFCPKCDMQFFPHNLTYGYNNIRFNCDKCGFTSTIIEKEPGHLEEWVSREIQRKLRTNEWKKNIPQQ